jgi:hypothetical protein
VRGARADRADRRRVSYGSLLFRAALRAAVTAALAMARGEPVTGDVPS